MKVFLKSKILTLDYFKHIHTVTHTEAPAHTSILTTQSLNIHSLKTGSKCPGDLIKSVSQRVCQVSVWACLS